MQNDILVSCTVVSYNSSATVLETLESIKAQTYQNIELIVSDDCSTDNTVELCRKWIADNKERFVRAILLTVEKNTGVVANGNRALAECHGVWQKGIAADDILLPNCITDFINYVKEHPKVKWVASKVAVYNESFKDECCIQRNKVYNKSFFEKGVEEQLKWIAWQNVIFAPSLFFQVDFKRRIGGYDTAYGFEDHPFYIKALENGYKCYYLDKETVGYRIHQSQYHSKGCLFNYSFLQKSRLFEQERCFLYLTKKQILLKKSLWCIQDLLQIAGLNRNKPRIIDKMYRAFWALILKWSKL